MSHGDRVEALPPGLRAGGLHAPARPSPRCEDRGAGSTACSSTPRWSTRRAARSCSGNFALRHLRLLAAPGRCAAFVEEAVEQIRAQVRRRATSSAASRAASTRRWRRCSCTGPSATGCAASSSTTACCAHGEREQVEEVFGRIFHLPLVTVDARDALPRRRSPASPTPRQKRKIIGREFIDVFEEEVERLAAHGERAQLPGAGHALPRRHRVGVVQGAVGHHQEPPQRGRPARGDEARAGRAAARAVQGRGARGSGASWACPSAIGAAPALPGAGPGRPRAGRGDRGAARRCCARPTPSCRRRSARPGCYEQALAVLRRAPAGAQRRRDGRRAHLRGHLRHPRGGVAPTA